MVDLRRVAAIVACALVGFCVPALHAQTAYDTPQLVVVTPMPSAVVLHVTAGPSGAPMGFTVDWMKRSDFDLVGGWPQSDYAPGTGTAVCSGSPTLHSLGTDFALEPGQTVTFVIGELFDETGVGTTNTDELKATTEYVVRVRAEGSAEVAPSSESATLFIATTTNTNCTFTQGFWKSHPEAWPVTSLTLGTVTYSASQLMAILNTPAMGNGLISLAHQLISAKLSIAFGADPTPIASTLSTAAALIGSKVVPPVGSGFLAPSTTAALTNTLDQYVNGLLGVQHCDVVPTTPRTWGSLKALYR